MSTAKMSDFMAAQRAAELKGIKVKKVEDRADVGVADAKAARAVWAKRAVAVMLALVVGILGYQYTVPPKAEAWKAYPTDRDELVRQFFGYVHDDTDASAKAAYALISRQAKNPADADEAGKYFQNFHDLARYLNGTFGKDWNDTLRIEHDDGKGAGDLDTAVHVQTEVFHLPLDLQGPDGLTPEQLAARPDAEHRYGVRAIAEFPIDRAGKSQQIEGITGVLKVYGANGSAEQLTGILNTSGSPLHETAMACKLRLLPVVRRPKATGLQRAIHQLWPVRQDATVRATLEAIMGDDAYDPLIRAVAKRVHDGTEDEEALVADGVNING
jgi:hypothetical protein